MPRFDTPANHLQTGPPRFGAALLFAAFSLSAPAYAQSTPKDSHVPKPQPTRRIVVSIPDRKLALLEDGHAVKIYYVAVGAQVSPSPSGEFQIAHRVSNPTYYKPGVVIAPGPGNPLGTRWIGLGVRGFGIHGTNRPSSIGKNASHGCIRLKNSDMEDLFARVRVGDRVSLLAERTEEVAELFGGEVSPTKVVNDQTQVARAESTNTEDNARGSE
jgi:lipoprotein-anchoring transpeptidase ErfK/SrfK